MDADLSHDPADLARLLAAVRDGGADLALGSRYVPGGGVADWGAIRRVVSRGGSWYARRDLGLQVRDLTGGFKCFRAEVLRAIDLPSVRSRGYAFQVELTYRAIVRGLPRRRGADRLPRPRAGDVEDVLADHRRGGVARAAAAPRRRAPPTSGRGPQGGAIVAPNRYRVNVSELALVQGMDDTAPAAALERARPAASCARGRSARWRSRVALLLAVWVIASTSSRPTPRRSSIAGLNEPADLGALGHVLFRNSLVLALHAMACVAGFIAGSSLPMQAEHHRGWWRRVHEKAGPAAIVFVAAATTFSLCTQAYVLGSGAATLAAQLDIGRGMLMLTLLPHALPGARRPLPAAGGVDARQPPRGVGRAAGRDRRDHRHRRPDADRGGDLEVFVWPSLLRLASPLG